MMQRSNCSRCQPLGFPINLFETSFFLSREIVVATKNTGMAHWRETLSALMSRNAGSVADFFYLTGIYANCCLG